MESIDLLVLRTALDWLAAARHWRPVRSRLNPLRHQSN